MIKFPNSMTRRLFILLAFSLAPILGFAQQQIPRIRLVPVASQLKMPVGVFDDGTGRLFVIEQDGMIVIVENGQIDPTPFLDIHDEVSRTGNECGLLGLAFHPDFKNNHRFYVNYDTEKFGKLQTRISEFTADPTNSHTDPSTEKELMRFDQPYTNHKGGCLMFGPDKMLYDGQGDGGDAGDPHDNGQNVGVYLGKILRIDVDHGQPYKVPDDNPLVGQKGAMPEIWCWGMRNPWRFSFDSQTGKLWCGDVGQDLWEEIDIIEKGKNYGWSAMEGTHPFKPERAIGTLTGPIKDYGHDEGKCIIGGYVYRGKAIPALDGLYVYGDYNIGWIAALGYDGQKITFDSHLLQTPVNIASFGEDHEGELYLVDRERGELFLIAP
jgi:glucose/arabinose dehydrogenase